MNNANFGYYCWYNANNIKFEPIIDEVNDITYIKKYYYLFDSKISNFVNSDVLEQEIEQNFQQQIASVKHDDPFRSARIDVIKSHNREDLDVLKSQKKNERKSKRENLLGMSKKQTERCI